MGKAASNEQIKLKAAWCNNVSVGALVGGFFVPYFTGFTNTIMTGTFGRAEITTILAMLIALAVSAYEYSRALTFIEKIQD